MAIIYSNVQIISIVYKLHPFDLFTATTHPPHSLATMKLALLLSTAALALAIASDDDNTRAAAPNCPGRHVSPAEQLCIFKDFVKLFYVTKDIPTAFQTHVAESYIQHNPMFTSGRQVAQDGLSKYIPPINITVAKISLSDSTGWVMAKQQTSAQVAEGKGMYTVVVDVFRMDGSCIVEHWDVAQARPAAASNPLVMFDQQTLGDVLGGCDAKARYKNEIDDRW